MERITYRRILDTTSTGYQYVLQGFQTGEHLSRRIIISLSQGSAEYDFPTDNSVIAAMYVKRPGETTCDINVCMVDALAGEITYDVLQSDIAVPGIVEMQLKLVQSGVDGAANVLISPKFLIEVQASSDGDSEAERTEQYTSLETALAQARAYYDSRIVSITTNEDLEIVFTYADGTTYESNAVNDAVYSNIAIMNSLVDEAEAWANGQKDGVDVDSTADQYHNNSKWFAEVSRQYSEASSDYADASQASAQESAGYAQSCADDKAFITEKTKNIVFDIDSDGNLVYTDNTAYSFSINEDGELEYTATF